MSFQDPPSPLDDLRHSPSTPDYPISFQDPPSPLDDLRCSPGPFSDPQQPPDPLNDQLDDDACPTDSSTTSEDSEDEDMLPQEFSQPDVSASLETGYEPWNELENNLPEDENDEGIATDDADNEVAPDLGDSLNVNEELPQPTLPMLVLANDMIQNIKAARLEDDLPAKMLASLRNPPQEPNALDPKAQTSMGIFNALLGGSQKMYNAVRHVLSRHRPQPVLLHSYHVIKKKIEQATCVKQVETHMCINSCIAYTGPFKNLEKCPKCGIERYKDSSKTQPRQRFYTIPLGPQIQALWRTPDGADRMRYRNRKTEEIIQELKRSGKIPKIEDVFHGTEYLDRHLSGKIGPDDVVVVFTVDGAQLYRDKESDCWLGVWVVLDLSPDQRYKMRFVLPACFVPGPNKPDNMESFLLPSFRHVSALQKEGLRVYDGRQQRYITSRPFFAFGAADTVALPVLSGSVRHHGNNGCRLSCGMPGRHKPNTPTYYPVVLQPQNYTVTKCNHVDFDITKLGLPSAEFELNPNSTAAT